MNKKLLAVAVAGAFAASGAAFAGDKHHGGDHGPGAKVNGHIFSTFTLTDDFGGDPNESEKKFHTDAELNIKAMVAEGVYARVDLDYGLGGDTDGGDGIEQAYGAWKINDMVKVQIGRFNSPLGIEAHDQADLNHFITHGQVRHALNDATALTGGTDGNNIEGVAAHLMAGPAKITLGLLNDIGDVPEENSILLNISGSPIEGLDLSLGTITQDDDDNGGDLINFNAAYSLAASDMPIKVWLDYLTAAEIVDSVISIGGSVGFSHGFGVALRYDVTSYANDTDETSITLAASWQAADNFDLRIEWRNDEFENGTTVDGDTLALAAAFRF